MVAPGSRETASGCSAFAGITLPAMRIILEHAGEVGFRAGRILLGDRRVETVGLVDKQPTDDYGGRVRRVRDWSTYDLAITDSEEPASFVNKSAASGVSCVVWVQIASSDAQILPTDITVLSGANLAAGIAPALASHEIARAEEVTELTIAWTEPGSPLRSGEPIAFPDPVGGRWGRRQAPGRLVAPIAGDWAAAMAEVTSSRDDDGATRIVGVSDHAPHLEAIALAAGALAVGSGAYTAGYRQPGDAGEAFLAEALGVGLDVAAYTINGS